MQKPIPHPTLNIAKLRLQKPKGPKLMFVNMCSILNKEHKLRTSSNYEYLCMQFCASLLVGWQSMKRQKVSASYADQILCRVTCYMASA